MILTIGRVGIEMALNGPQSLNVDADPDDRRLTIRGFIRSTTLGNTRVLADTLAAQTGRVIPLTWDFDPTFDGFYIQLAANIDLQREQAAEIGPGYFKFSVSLQVVGRESKVRFQVMSASQVLSNNHSMFASDVLFHSAGPVGAYAVDASGLNLINTHTRQTEDGPVQCYIDIDQVPIRKPSWAVSPANYYKGGCKLYVGGILDTSGAIQTTGGVVRTGTDVPMLPHDWMLTNGLLRVVPGVTAGVNDGRVGIAAWDGSAWDAPQYFRFRYDPAGTPGVNDRWHSLTVIHYTTEKTIIRLERDANEFNPTTHMHRLDIHLRRGDPYFSGYYFYSGGVAPAWGLGVLPTAAAVDVTPTSGPVTGITATTAVNGHKWTIVTPTTNTQDNANGELRWASVDRFRFGLGFDINAATSAALDDDDSLHVQYMARTEEKERAVRR